jgi:hypothetical protein
MSLINNYIQKSIQKCISFKKSLCHGPHFADYLGIINTLI